MSMFVSLVLLKYCTIKGLVPMITSFEKGLVTMSHKVVHVLSILGSYESIPLLSLLEVLNVVSLIISFFLNVCITGFDTSFHVHSNVISWLVETIAVVLIM